MDYQNTDMPQKFRALPPDFREELAQPTVIVDMPELRRMVVRKQIFRVFVIILSILGCAFLGGLNYMELTSESKEVVNVELPPDEPQASSITLTVKLVPGDISGAVVEVDGEVISGNPPYVYLKPSEDYHSIKVTAPGFDDVTKDVQLTISEVMTFALTEIVQPDSSSEPIALATLDPDKIPPSNEIEVSQQGSVQEVAVEKENVAASKRDEVRVSSRPGAKKLSNRGRATRKGPQERVIKEGRKSSASVKRADSTGVSAARTAVVPPTPPVQSAPPASGVRSDEGDRGDGGEIKYGLGPAPAGKPYQASKASLIINAPLGMNSRVAVSVDGQMRGYLPVLLKIDSGLHELTFVYEGHRSFQMVKLSPGQIARIVPNL